MIHLEYKAECKNKIQPPERADAMRQHQPGAGGGHHDHYTHAAAYQTVKVDCNELQ